MSAVKFPMWVFVLGAGLQAAELPETEEVDTWGARREHLAVVNPVLGDDKGNVISLRGDWVFSTMGCGSRNGMELKDRLYSKKNWPGERKIYVPACWEAQGVGRPGMSECWDIKGDNNEKPIRHCHVGYACYRKTVPIPKSWKGKRIWLKIGGVKACGWFWVNEHQVAMNENYCGTYKYEITDLVQPGSNATVVAQVTTSRPSRKGLMSAMHKWGGIYRDIEIEATPHTFIDDAWVRGDFDGRAAEVNVDICRHPAAGRLGAQSRLRVTVDGAVKEQPLYPSRHQVVRFPLKSFRPWSPEHPNLYTARVDIVENGCVVHTRRERFGVRKFEVRGKEFFLNGKPFFLRGFGDDAVYPITGITPADRDFHRRNLLKARKAGFNFVRLHTHCEVPEYFEAADEAGIMIQAEIPYYGDNTAEAMSFDPKRDLTELWRNYRRYPSFAIYCTGNEGSFGPVLDRRLYKYVKSIDKDRMMIGQDCNDVQWSNPPDSADFRQTHSLPWAKGRVNYSRPFVAHEYLNLAVKCDSRDESLYTGIWFPPATRKARSEWLGKFGLGMEWGDKLQNAQHALQRHYQKQGIEHLRADPYCDGYWFWTLVDVVVENRRGDRGIYTAQGLLNPFWMKKRGGASVEEFARFNGQSSLLLDIPDTKRVFVGGDTLMADFLFAHYGNEPVENGSLAWRVIARDGCKRILEGRMSVPGKTALGPARKIGTAKIVFPHFAKPVKAKIEAEFGGVSNAWDIWLLPKRNTPEGRRVAAAEKYRSALEKLYPGLLGQKDAAKADVVVAQFGSRLAKEALDRGQRVVMLADMGGKPNVRLGWWWLGKQTGVAIADHPALAGLPHDGVLNPLLFRLVLHGGLALPCKGLSQEDMLMVGEGGTNCVLHIGQARIGKGKACMAFGLDLLNGTPEAVALLDSLIDYAASDCFAPKSEMTMDVEPIREKFSLFKPFYDRVTAPMLIPVGDTEVRRVQKIGEAGSFIELSLKNPRKDLGFLFWRFGAPQGALAPKFPVFESGELIVDVENTHPVGKMALRIIDTGSNVHTLPVAAPELKTPGRHIIRVQLPQKLEKRNRRGKVNSFGVFALGGFDFLALKPVAGTAVRIHGVSMEYSARPADALSLEIDTGTLPRIVNPRSASRGVEVGVRNITRSELVMNVSLKLLDVNGTDAGWSVSERLAFGPGEVKKFRCSVPEKYGVFYVDMKSCPYPGAVPDMAEQRRSFAHFNPVGADRRTGEEPKFRFGSVCHLNPYFGNEAEIVRLADAMAQIGLNILRTNFKPASPSDYEWYDKIVDIFSARGMDFDFILDAKCFPDGKPDIEKNMAEYQKAFARYKGRVRYWEFENEPDIDWGRKHPLRVPGYVQLAELASSALRRIDPDAEFMSSGFCCFDNPIMGTFQRDAMSRCWRAFDLHCFHGHGPYREYRDMIDGNLLPMRKELGIEIPWYANETALTMSNGVGEKEQAEALVKKLLFSWSRGAKGYTWYNMRGKGENPFENEHGYGMLTMKLDPRAVYCVWNALIGICRGKSFEREIDCGEGNRCFLLRGAEGWAACLWRERAGKERVVLRTAATDVSKIDMFGNASPYEIVDNRIALDVSQEPIWLLSELGKDLILQ